MSRPTEGVQNELPFAHDVKQLARQHLADLSEELLERIEREHKAAVEYVLHDWSEPDNSISTVSTEGIINGLSAWCSSHYNPSGWIEGGSVSEIIASMISNDYWLQEGIDLGDNKLRFLFDYALQAEINEYSMETAEDELHIYYGIKYGASHENKKISIERSTEEIKVRQTLQAKLRERVPSNNPNPERQ